MATKSDRRSFLKTSATSLVTLGGIGQLTNLAARGQESAPARSSRDVESLMRLMESTPRDKIAPVFVDQLRKGVSRDDMLKALFYTAARNAHGHNILVHHSVSELSSSVGPSERLLPLFWHMDLLKVKDSSTPRSAPSQSQLPSSSKAASVFEEAVRGLDQDAAVKAIIALARSEGPKKAFRRIWWHAAGGRLFNSIGHSVIRVANTWRSMENVGWQNAERILSWNARTCSGTKTLDKGNLHVLNRRRASQHHKLPGNWMRQPSDAGAVVDLHSLFREGKANDACDRVFKQLQSSQLSPASIWDAVFLTSNELSARYKWGGPSGRPRHSITGSNALHFMYRTWTDPEMRLFTLLQAVAMICVFADTIRRSGNLNDFDITKIGEANSPDTVEDAVDEIFSLLPPRRFEARFRDVSGQHKALAQTFAMAKKHGDQKFIDRAKHLLCLKNGVDAHHLKFAIAALENYQHVSAKWRPNHLAASVFVLQGTQMEDNAAVQQARGELRTLD